MDFPQYLYKNLLIDEEQLEIIKEEKEKKIVDLIIEKRFLPRKEVLKQFDTFIKN